MRCARGTAWSREMGSWWVWRWVSRGCILEVGWRWGWRDEMLLSSWTLDNSCYSHLGIQLYTIM